MPSSNFPLVPVTWKNPRWPPRNPKIIDITKSRKLLDESCWFFYMFFFIQYNDRMQTAVLPQSRYFFVFLMRRAQNMILLIAYVSNITSGNFSMLIFVNMYISFLYVPRMPKKHVYIFFFFWEPCQIFFWKLKKMTNSNIVTCLPFIILSLSQYLGPKLFLPV